MLDSTAIISTIAENAKASLVEILRFFIVVASQTPFQGNRNAGAFSPVSAALWCFGFSFFLTSFGRTSDQTPPPLTWHGSNELPRDAIANLPTAARRSVKIFLKLLAHNDSALLMEFGPLNDENLAD